MSHWTCLWIGIGTTCLGLVLMGMPGAVLMEAVSRTANLLRIRLPDLGDRAWPLAITITIVWGPLLYACYWLTRWLAWAEWTTWPLWLLAGLVVTVGIWRGSAK